MALPNVYGAWSPQLDINNRPLLVTREAFKGVIGGLDDPVGNQIFDGIWGALVASNGHIASDPLLHFNISPLKIDKEILKATIGGLGDPVGDQAFDGLWEAMLEKVQHPLYATAMPKVTDGASTCCVDALSNDFNVSDHHHHWGNRGNQINIDSVSKKRKADGGIVESRSEDESISKKQKLAPEVNDSTDDNSVNDVLLLRGGKKRVNRVIKIPKRNTPTANRRNADETVSTTGTTSEQDSTSKSPNNRTRLLQLSNSGFAKTFASLINFLNTTFTPYKYEYFTEAQIARDDALYSPPSVPNPQPAIFFGTEEERRLRRLFPAFESSEDTAIVEDPLALFEASREGKFLKKMEEMVCDYEKGFYEAQLMNLWWGVMAG